MLKLTPLKLPPVLLGVQSKPSACKTLCPYYSLGEGYVAGHCPPDAKILVMIASPSSDDLINRKLLSGRAGHSFYKNYIYPLGYSNDDVAVSAVMRCRPKGGKFPVGFAKKALTEACRYYDLQEVKQFNPNCYIISQSLKDTYQEVAFKSLMERDFRKAADLVTRGLRPIVLMGQEASEMLAPFIIGQGGTKRWRGHWMEMDVWPFFLSGSREPEPTKGFQPAR